MDTSDYIAVYAAAVSTAVAFWDIIKYFRERYRLEVTAFGNNTFAHYLGSYEGNEWHQSVIFVRLSALREATTLNQARLNFYTSRFTRLLKRPVWSGALVKYEDEDRKYRVEKTTSADHSPFSIRLESNDSVEIELFAHAYFDVRQLPLKFKTPGFIEFEIRDASRRGIHRTSVSLPRLQSSLDQASRRSFWHMGNRFIGYFRRRREAELERQRQWYLAEKERWEATRRKVSESE